MSTKVSATSRFYKQLSRVPTFIVDKVNFWIWEVQTVGIATAMKRPGYHDEPLKGNRFGQRSVRLSRSYRLIYRVKSTQLQIELLEVTKHDY